ncbi:S24 family peptidase [Parvibaculum sp.]|uniref:S24 family peptidase n=1 Tax=Parvibaculum sp. TaxID=2024848 RepID=UPI001DE2D923|nr:S24 family peptidase [Parvibaculum sp.]MBX3490867.1 helix-turn-helix transcriptional regulator [Parvibaculum sp.]
MDYPALAQRSGVSLESIKKYAQGGVDAPRGGIPEKLAKALRVHLSWLMLGEGPMEKEHVGNTPDLPESAPDRTTVDIPEYDVRAGMGNGFVVDAETIKDLWTFSRRYLVDELRLAARNLVVIELIGDSMAPTLHSGDRALVDMSDKRVGTPGIFALWDGDGTVAKRLERIPNAKPEKIRLISDNPLHGTYEVMAEDTNIIGRIVWFARRM